MLVATLSPRVVLATMAVLGSGVGLVVVAGTALTAYVWMVLVASTSISTILLLRRRADPVRHMVRTPQAAPQRTAVRVIASRPSPASLEAARLALPAAEPDVTYTADRRAVEGWR
jgi:hypothetical protein